MSEPFDPYRWWLGIGAVAVSVIHRKAQRAPRVMPCCRGSRRRGGERRDFPSNGSTGNDVILVPV